MLIRHGLPLFLNSIFKGHVLARRILPGLPLTLGITLVYVAIIVVLPLGALIFKAASLGPEDYWRIVSSERAIASYRVTILCALAAHAVQPRLRYGPCLDHRALPLSRAALRRCPGGLALRATDPLLPVSR